MLAALLALVLVLVLLLCVVAALVQRDRRPSPWAEKVRRPAVVTLRSGVAFQGLVWSVEGDLMVLREAAIVTPDGPTPADGEVVLERSQVDYVQVLA